MLPSIAVFWFFEAVEHAWYCMSQNTCILHVEIYIRDVGIVFICLCIHYISFHWDTYSLLKYAFVMSLQYNKFVVDVKNLRIVANISWQFQVYVLKHALSWSIKFLKALCLSLLIIGASWPGERYTSRPFSLPDFFLPCACFSGIKAKILSCSLRPMPWANRSAHELGVVPVVVEARLLHASGRCVTATTGSNNGICLRACEIKFSKSALCFSFSLCLRRKRMAWGMAAGSGFSQAHVS